MRVDDVMHGVVAFVNIYVSCLKLKYKIRDLQEEALSNREATVEEIGKVYGCYYPKSKRVAFVASHIKDEDSLKRTLRHELIGHFGLNTITAEQKRNVLTAINQTRSKPDLKSDWDKVYLAYKNETKDMQAEELFAILCESEEVDLVPRTEAYFAVEKILMQGHSDVSRNEILAIASHIAQGLRNDEPQKIFPLTDNDHFKAMIANLKSRVILPNNNLIHDLLEEEDANTSKSQFHKGIDYFV